MKSTIAYKDCLIRGESFQREKNGAWIPQYHCTRQKIALGDIFPAQQYQLPGSFASEELADDFALQQAMAWIDSNWASGKAAAQVIAIAT